MKELFAGYLKYSDEEFKEIWEKATFVVDTNVLLNFFKYSTKETTSTFFKILKDLKEAGRLYIPHHVALEFFFNYENIMHSQSDGINLLVNNLMELKKEANSVFNRVKSAHPYIINDNFKFILEDLGQLNQKLESYKAQEIDSLPSVEELKKDLFELMDGVIGEPYNQNKINEIEKEGKERYKHEVPPGWKDKHEQKKANFRTYGGIRYQQLYGDLIVWNQMIDKVKNESENTEPIIFITEEKKVDWWEKDDSDKIKRPQPHLIQEFLEKTKQKFYMYRTDNFVKHANKYLNAGVSEEQIQNLTTQVENIRKVEELPEVNYKSKVDVDQVLQYLSISERRAFDNMLESSYDLDLDEEVADFKHARAIKWGMEKALPRMENTLRSVANNLSLYDPAIARGVLYTLDHLPNDIDKRVFLLLDAIGYAKDKFKFYEVQAY
ncbi:PIN-like domain-containing protein [Priestia megaterium]|uniref:PIN-like domain-containing protein n=1 Tax=Priestia megaterium TaxID=1404 RepID=UPI00345A00FE